MFNRLNNAAVAAQSLLGKGALAPRARHVWPKRVSDTAFNVPEAIIAQLRKAAALLLDIINTPSPRRMLECRGAIMAVLQHSIIRNSAWHIQARGLFSNGYLHHKTADLPVWAWDAVQTATPALTMTLKINQPARSRRGPFDIFLYERFLHQSAQMQRTS